MKNINGFWCNETNINGFWCKRILIDINERNILMNEIIMDINEWNINGFWCNEIKIQIIQKNVFNIENFFKTNWLDLSDQTNFDYYILNLSILMVLWFFLLQSW